MLCTRFAYGAAHGAEARHRPRQSLPRSAQGPAGLAFNKMPSKSQMSSCIKVCSIACVRD